MGETYRVEIEVDDRAYVALQSEAERLGLAIPEVISRATAAWLNDMCESAVVTASVTSVAS